MSDMMETTSLVPETVSEKIAALVAVGATPDEAKQLATLAPASPAERKRASGHLSSVEQSLAVDPRTAHKLAEGLGQDDMGLAFALQEQALGATDEVERMLMNQILAMNGLALRATARAHSTEYVQQCDAYINQANKCSRTFAVLIETLSRYRGKTSEQKVTVQHVHVHEGGQAVVGNVAAPPGGRSRARKGHSTP